MSKKPEPTIGDIWTQEPRSPYEYLITQLTDSIVYFDFRSIVKQNIKSGNVDRSTFPKLLTFVRSTNQIKIGDPINVKMSPEITPLKTEASSIDDPKWIKTKEGLNVHRFYIYAIENVISHFQFFDEIRPGDTLIAPEGKYAILQKVGDDVMLLKLGTKNMFVLGIDYFRFEWNRKRQNQYSIEKKTSLNAIEEYKQRLGIL